MNEALVGTAQKSIKQTVEVTRLLMEKVAAARYENLGVDVVRASKRAIIDGLGCTIAGAMTRTGKTIREYALSESPQGECTLVGDGRRAGPAMAALANGTSGHALDYDDVQWQVVGHPTVCIVPAILALGEKHDKSGRDFILSYAVGIETGGKIGAGVNMHHYELGWHATGTLGTLAAAGAASKILGHDGARMRNAIGIAVSRAGGVRQNFGTDTKPFHAGAAGMNGVMAARLTDMGFTANTEILEAPWGFFHLFCSDRFDADKIVSNATEPWSVHTPGMLFKPYAACVSTHTAIDSMLALIKEHDIRAEDVERVDVGVVSLTQRILIHTRPKTGLNGKFSMQYSMARALLSRSLGMSQYTDEKVMDPAAQELLQRVDWHVDPELEAVWKGGPRPEIVHLYLKDGRKLTHRTDKSKGNPEFPLTDEEVSEKFRDCASACLPAKQVDTLLQKLWDLESVKSMREIAPLLAPQK